MTNKTSMKNREQPKIIVINYSCFAGVSQSHDKVIEKTIEQAIEFTTMNKLMQSVKHNVAREQACDKKGFSPREVFSLNLTYSSFRARCVRRQFFCKLVQC